MEYHHWLPAPHSPICILQCWCVSDVLMFQSSKVINIDIVHKLHFLIGPPPPLVILIKLLAQQFCAEQL